MNHPSTPFAVGTKTAAPIEPGNCASIYPEFGRWQDCQRLFGIRRSYLYKLIRLGRIKSCSLRDPGARTGVRLIHLESLRTYLHSHMEADQE